LISQKNRDTKPFLTRLLTRIGRILVPSDRSKGLEITSRAGHSTVKEVTQLAIIAVFAIVSFVIAAAMLGKDSRDGNDWSQHPRP
jgi:hypothetical protein